MLLALMLAAAPVPALPDAPAEGVDVDVRATLDEARVKLDAKDPSGDAQVLDLNLATDRFSKAQAKRVKDESVALLREAGALRVQQGDVELGARDLDAAWQLAGKGMDLQLAAALATWADRIERSDRAAALYLARRALLADPANPLALKLDHSLSNNPLRGVGYGLMGLGAAALISGIVFAIVANNTTSRIQSHEIRSTRDWDVLLRTNEVQRGLTVSSFVAAGLFYVGGVSLLALGKRDFLPTSPALIPALPELKP